MFLSPELLDDEPFTYSTDIWSLAVVVMTLMCYENPFGPTPPRYAMGVARGTRAPLPEVYSADFVRVLDRMLDKDKYLRLSLGQILEIPWCSTVTRGTTAWDYVYRGLVAEKGIGGQMDRQRAMTYYRTGADRGDVFGMVFLADMLSNGERGEKNLAEALRYYKKAADEGSAYAMNRAAIGYDEGWGGARNVGEARRYSEMAAQHGVESARADLEHLRRG
jgi:TPR repeat protein